MRWSIGYEAGHVVVTGYEAGHAAVIGYKAGNAAKCVFCEKNEEESRNSNRCIRCELSLG